MSSLVTVTRPHLGQVLAFTHTIQATSYNSQTYSSVSITINALVILVFLPLLQKSVVFFSSFGKLMTLEVRIMNFTPFWKRWELAHSLVLLLLSLFRTTVYTSDMVFFKYPIRTILTLHITKSLCAIMLLVTTSNANSLVYPILSFASSHAFRHSSSVVPQ